MKQPPKWKFALLVWLGIYPTITTVLWLLSPYLVSLPLPLKTLCLTAVVIPTMVWIVLPFLQKNLKNWLHR